MYVTNKGRVISLALAAVFAAGSLLALDVDKLPPDNWAVPSSRAGIRTTMTDATSPRAFIGLTPCRIVDTRGNGAPIQGGTFGVNQIRTWALSGKCGIPTGADAVSLNLTVTGTGANPFGFATLWPTGATQPTASNINWSAGGQTIANAVIVPLGTSGSVNVISGNAGTDMVLDVNGYFSAVLGTPGNFLSINNNSSGFSLTTSNASTSCGGACGILATVASNGIAIYGESDGAGAGIGVEGFGFGASAIGVKGIGGTADGKGVQGFGGGGGFGANGVEGRFGSLPGGSDPNVWISAGVAGFSQTGYGLHGSSEFNGAQGVLVNGSGTTLARGRLGFNSGGVDYAVFAQSNMGGTGAKFFVEPHPFKAGEVIRYISLEGDESGVYTRGQGQFQGGFAHVDLPESFRLVADRENLSIQVTPIGDFASVAVVSIDLDGGVTLKGSKSVRFFYTVNGVRRTHKDFVAMGKGTEFAPETSDGTIPAYLTPLQKQSLIDNGTYNPDGTANLATAKALGWDKAWEQRTKAVERKTTEVK